MDREEPAEGSSSPNVNPIFFRVVSIERGGKPSGSCKILLEDDSSFFISKEFIEKYGITEGREYEFGVLKLIEAKSMEELAYKKALELLAGGDHTEKRLLEKLRARSFSKAAAEKASERLIEEGFLNERHFAESWLLSRIKRHPESGQRLLAGLQNRGIPRELASQALSSVLTDFGVETVLDAAMEVLGLKTYDEIELRNLLKKRGFGFSEIDRYFRNLT